MTFTVVWKPHALDQLAEIWLNSNDRAAVSWATSEIDRCLRRDPEAEGESRTPDERLLVVRPLVIVFEVRAGDRVVEVLSVAEAKRR